MLFGPLAPVLGPQGRPVALVSTAADGSPDPIMAAIVARYSAEVAAADTRRRAIAAGLIPPAPPIGRWLISDRH
jgi:hypothetical protein